MVLSMEKWTGKVALVTGASAGCGAAIAESLVKYGLQVVGVARRKEKIEQHASQLSNFEGKLHAFRADVRIEAELLAAFEWTLKNVGPVAILINNAGISQPTTLINGNTEMWKKVFDTNVMALNIATREAIKHMQQHNIDGHIIHISSVLGHYVAQVPDINVYSASKFAVRALTETLRQELMARNSKIRVSSVSPGPIDTEWTQTSNLNEDKNFVEMWKTMPKLNAEDIADAVVYALSTPPHVQIQDIMMRPLGEPV